MRTENQKLVCPYCKAKQEYRAKDYFTTYGGLSLGVQCDSCDEKFNARRDSGFVESYSNLTYYPVDRSQLTMAVKCV